MEHSELEFSGDFGPEVIQKSESIEYRGAIYWLYGTPFDQFLRSRDDIWFEPYGDNDLKGYTAYWRLQDNKLYLISLLGAGHTLQSIFGNESEVLAEWFSGVIKMGLGEPIHTEWDVSYPYYLWLLVEKGVVIERRIIVPVDSIPVIGFGKYSGFNIRDVLYGRLHYNFDTKTICKHYIADIISFLTDNDFNQKIIVPFFSVTDDLRSVVDTFRNTKIRYLLTDDFIAIEKQSNYSESAQDVSEKLSALVEEILTTSFYTSLTLKKPAFPDAGVAQSCLLINADHSYISWAIKNVEVFSVPPHLMSEKFIYSRLKKFTLTRLNTTIFEYRPDLEILSFEFSEQVKNLNIAKYKKLHQLVYDSKYDIYVIGMEGDELSNNFGHFLDESFVPGEDNELMYEDDYDYNYDSNYDYERDYFDAITDGQLGDYDEFRENGGDIDDIETWSRG